MSDLEGLIRAFCDIEKKEQMGRFLKEILSPHEMHDLALRWKALQRLSDGATQRKTARELGISLCKVTRAARVLKDRHSVCYSILNRRSQETQDGK